MPFIGETIALTTVLCWTLSIQCFEAASVRIGPIPVNIIRISCALLLFSVLLLFREGSLVPLHFPLRAWMLLGLSGIVGFFFGDIFLFKALVEIGPRVAMLIFSLAAPTAALFGWLFLAETYLAHQWLGMAVTLTGVGLVIVERQRATAKPGRARVRTVSLKGVVFASLGMLGQAGGYLLSKAGMQTASGYLDAFSATQIRAIAAFFCFVIFFTVSHKWRYVRKGIGDSRAVALTVAGAIVGPFIGVSLSLLTLHYLETGVASTFLSLVPVCIIPFSIFLHREYVSIRAGAGAIIAVAGIGLLMM